MTRRTAESAARNIGALRLRLLRGLRSRRGEIRDARMGKRAPLAAVKIALVLRVVIIVRLLIPRTKRRVIITNAWNVVVVGVNVVGRDGRRLVRAATG